MTEQMVQDNEKKLCESQGETPIGSRLFSFILLAYRNHHDVKSCLESIGGLLDEAYFDAIVVDSYYSEEESSLIDDAAKAYGAAYVPVSNKGYGYGNNIGIERALNNIDSDYIVVCNPDTEIKSIDLAALYSLTEAYGIPSEAPYIIAPQIKTLNGKDQNPLVPSKSELYESLVYRGYKTRKRYVSLAGFALNRLKRELFLRAHPKMGHSRIYAPHGSFILFSRKAAEMLNPVFDEQMFLFAEEHLLAWRAAQRNIPIVYCPFISVLHKEDGSVQLLTEANELMRESNVYVYEKTHGVLPEATEKARS